MEKQTMHIDNWCGSPEKFFYFAFHNKENEAKFKKALQLYVKAILEEDNNKEWPSDVSNMNVQQFFLENPANYTEVKDYLLQNKILTLSNPERVNSLHIEPILTEYTSAPDKEKFFQAQHLLGERKQQAKIRVSEKKRELAIFLNKHKAKKTEKVSAKSPNVIALHNTIENTGDKPLTAEKHAEEIISFIKNISLQQVLDLFQVVHWPEHYLYDKAQIENDKTVNSVLLAYLKDPKVQIQIINEAKQGKLKIPQEFCRFLEEQFEKNTDFFTFSATILPIVWEDMARDSYTLNLWEKIYKKNQKIGEKVFWTYINHEIDEKGPYKGMVALRRFQKIEFILFKLRNNDEKDKKDVPFLKDIKVFLHNAIPDAFEPNKVPEKINKTVFDKNKDTEFYNEYTVTNYIRPIKDFVEKNKALQQKFPRVHQFLYVYLNETINQVCKNPKNTDLKPELTPKGDITETDLGKALECIQLLQKTEFAYTAYHSFLNHFFDYLGTKALNQKKQRNAKLKNVSFTEHVPRVSQLLYFIAEQYPKDFLPVVKKYMHRFLMEHIKNFQDISFELEHLARIDKQVNNGDDSWIKYWYEREKNSTKNDRIFWEAQAPSDFTRIHLTNGVLGKITLNKGQIQLLKKICNPQATPNMEELEKALAPALKKQFPDSKGKFFTTEFNKDAEKVDLFRRVWNFAKNA